MYYASGTYEAFARPLKPEGVDQKSAYIIGTGLAALTVFPSGCGIFVMAICLWQWTSLSRQQRIWLSG